jgi:peptidoglycan/LPS O-acetylase OafA/YrhL
LNVHIGNEKYPALTGIRALGALAVFTAHYFRPGTGFTINVMAFFFVLSGFLIVRIYNNGVSLSSGWIAKYLINRFARIYPLYFLLLTIAILLHPSYIDTAVILRNYTLTQALFDSKHLIIEPTWTLTVEECFYFIAPLIMVLVRRYNFYYALFLSIALLGAGLLVSELPISFLHSKNFIFTTTYLGHFFEFYCGVALALIVMKKEDRQLPGIKGMKWTLAGTAGVISLLVAMQFVYSMKPLNVPLVVLLNNFLIPVPIAVLYYGFIFERSAFSGFLSSKTMGMLGRSSYAFYVLHILVITYFSRPLLEPYMNNYMAFIITLAITTLLSILLFIFYEEPLNLLIRKKLKTRSMQKEVPVWLPAVK